MRMETLTLRESQYDVVLGPCPGCQLWQLDYTLEVAQTYAVFETFSEYELGSEEPIMATTRVDPSPFYEVVEDALREHLDACPHLQRALFD